MFNGTRRDYETPSREDVLALVNKFLDSPQRKSERGGFASVGEHDVSEINDLVTALIKYRYEADPDGDRPIRWRFLDWKKVEIPQGFILPRIDWDSPPDWAHIHRVMGYATANVKIATEALDSIMRAVRFFDEEKAGR